LVLPLLLSVLAISLGSSLLAKEEKSGTIELLLSRPVSRARLIAGKALAGVLTLVAVSSAATLTTIVAAKLVDLKVGSLQILLANAAACLLALSFGAIAFLLTSLGRARAASLGVATAFAMGGYIIASLQGAADWLKWPAKIFPFNYYRPAEIFKSSYSWIHLLFIVGVIVVCGCLSYISFKRRDITS
jgi:ABC-2 type transport system permease protein